MTDASGNKPEASSPQPEAGTGETQPQLALGDFHSCLLTTEGNIKCWGNNTFGRLGLGDTRNRGEAAGAMGRNLPYVDLGGRKAEGLAAGREHTCAVAAGEVFCWGRNKEKQLGVGLPSSRQAYGDQPGDMGVNLRKVLLPAKAVSVALGALHGCALLETGKVSCWGDDAFGQLGASLFAEVDLGPNYRAKTLVSRGFHTCAIVDDDMGQDKLRCWGWNIANQLGYSGVRSVGEHPAVDLGTGMSVKSVATGAAHTCALRSDDKIVCWGEARDGALGLPGKAKQAGMGDQLTPLNWGGAPPQALAAGLAHTCAWLTDNHLICWGSNGISELGRWTDEPFGLPGEVELGASFKVASMAVGGYHACILASKGLKCFGRNADGQLGLGDRKDRFRPEDMGDALPWVDLGL